MRKRIAAMTALSLTALALAPLGQEDCQARGGRGGGGHGGGFRGGPGRMEGRARFDGHYDNLGHWGRGAPGRWGRAGGWARPYHRFYGYGWGGWYAPGYGVGMGYAADDVDRQIIDDEATMYAGADYGYAPAAIPGGGATSASVEGEIVRKAAGQPPKIVYRARYKLGPDADVLEDGKIAFRLTDDAFLLVTDTNLLVIDEKSGQPVMELYPDPTLMWHLGSELKQQALGLGAALERKKAQLDNKAVIDSPDKAAKLAREIKNIADTVALLSKAGKNLGALPEDPPRPVEPPDSDAIEIFASVYMLRDGKFVIIKREDGSYAYIDGRGIYADRSKSPLKTGYPDKFELVVWNYLDNLVKEAPDTKANLEEDIDATKWALEQLSSEIGDARSKEESQDSQEAVRRITEAMSRTKNRHSAISNQLETMPDEIAAARLTMDTLKQ
ncbi:MAG: hypothetical protein IPM23_23120 [Candidatus Melainabacteria bacterium]|nr:hypothetical protein [Candidatus Melainabacteria bacterium]